jgi:PTS system nitrogen regulatory IIA component
VLTDIFFLIGSSDDVSHLRLLARMSRLLQNPQLLDDFRHTASAGDVWQLIVDAESELDKVKGS